jgi:PKD repeat protein
VTTNGCSSAASTAITVKINQPTTITGQPVGQTVNVGQSVTFSATASGTDLIYQWRKGTENISGATFDSYMIPSVSAADAGTYSVVVTGRCGTLTSSDATLIVNNSSCATPVVSITGPASGAVYAAGTPVNFTGAFTDASGGTHTATWSFDSITQAGVVNEAAGTVSRSYTFTQAGVYMVTLTVTNSCGQQGTANQVSGQTAMVVIYDPSAGFVTGGGWITSPLGAYVADPTLTGRANFAFVSRYQRGTTVPTGETEFIFQLAGLRFQSTAYEWLVVSGARAQFKGSGAINGAGNFGFLLTATDGQLTGGGGTDKFRIKIWDRATGQVVYDNQMGASDSADPTTVIGGGSIVIQSR